MPSHAKVVKREQWEEGEKGGASGREGAGKERERERERGAGLPWWLWTRWWWRQRGVWRALEGGCFLDWTHVKLISSGLCFWTRLELVCLANDVPSACTTHSPRLSYCLPPSFPLLSLSLCYQPPTIHPPAPTLCFSLCHLSLPSLSVLGACVLAGLFEIWCQIGGPSARWHRLSQWLEKESGEEERKRETELERKRGKKEAALGFASGRAHSSNIDSVLLFCFFPPSVPPVQLSLSLSVSFVHILENWTDSTSCFANPFRLQDHFSFNFFADKGGFLTISSLFYCIIFIVLCVCSFWTSLNSFYCTLEQHLSCSYCYSTSCVSLLVLHRSLWPVSSVAPFFLSFFGHRRHLIFLIFYKYIYTYKYIYMYILFFHTPVCVLPAH